MKKVRKKTQRHDRRRAKLGPSKAKRRQKRKDEADARRAAYFEELISINRIGEKKK